MAKPSSRTERSRPFYVHADDPPAKHKKQRAVIEAYLEALDRNSDSVLYVQDFLRHFWPLMPAAVKRQSIAGEVRKMLAAGKMVRP
jgi:hypothetical protein